MARVSRGLCVFRRGHGQSEGGDNVQITVGKIWEASLGTDPASLIEDGHITLTAHDHIPDSFPSTVDYGVQAHFG